MKSSSSSKNIARILTGGIVAAGLLAAGQLNAADTTVSGSVTTPGATTTGSTATSTTSHKASSFIKEASEGNQAEIALANLAEQKSQNSEIKQLAQMIREDHQQAQQKLQTIAQAHGVTLDQTPTWTQRRAQNKLEKLNGAEFDQTYAKDMLEDHAKDINKFQKAAQDLEESDVKEYAQECVSKMQTHLQHAESAAKAVGVDQKTISSYTEKVSGGSMGGTVDKSETMQGTDASRSGDRGGSTNSPIVQP